MARTRIYLGSVGSRTVKALVLTSDTQQMSVAVIDAANGAAAGAKVALSRLNPSPNLAKYLDFSIYKVVVSTLVPGMPYRICVGFGLGGAIEHWSSEFKTLDPNADNLSIVASSCFYLGYSYESQYAAYLKSQELRDANFKILMGDNLYLDCHDSQRDLSLFDGFKETAYLYSKHFWESEDYAEMVGSTPTFSTWDDHEFWNNFPEDCLWLTRTWSQKWRRDYSKAGLESVDLFQNSTNPDCIAGSRSYVIRDTPLVEFFVLDSRTQRTRMDAKRPSIAPETVISAFESWSKNLKSKPGVLVIGQPMLAGPGGSTDYNIQAFDSDFGRICRAIVAAPANILVMSGDVHYSRVAEFQIEDFADSARTRRKNVTEVVTSPSCHIPIGRNGASVGMKSKVEYPTGRLQLVHRGYQFGASCANSIATLHFSRGGSGQVEVGVKFVDLATMYPPLAEYASESLFKKVPPSYGRCEVEKLVSL